MKCLELYNILMSDNVVENINNKLNDLLYLIPELNSMIGFKHNHPHHHLDVWNHTLLSLSYSPKDFEVRLALLLHDIGKPHCYQDEEVRRFRGHSKVSSIMAFNILKRLNFDNDEIYKLCYLIEFHDTPITNEEIIDNEELSLIRFKIQCCDALAHNPTKLEKRINYLLDINDKMNNNSEKEKCRKLLLSFYK